MAMIGLYMPGHKKFFFIFLLFYVKKEGNKQMSKNTDFNANPMYKDIQEFYKHKKEFTATQKKKIRRVFNDTFPGRTYNSLNKYEKKVLFISNLQDYMYEKVLTAGEKKHVNQKIQKIRAKFHLPSIPYKCPDMDLIYKVFYNIEEYKNLADTPEEMHKEKKNNYNAYKRALKVCSRLAPPTFEEWIADNEAWIAENGKAPSIFDWEYWVSTQKSVSEDAFTDLPATYKIVQRQKAYENKLHQEEADLSPYAYERVVDNQPDLQAKIDAHADHILLLTIAKILKECQIADIDIEKIKQTCAAQIYHTDDPNNSEAELEYLKSISGELELDNAIYDQMAKTNGTLNNAPDRTSYEPVLTYETFSYTHCEQMISELDFYNELENYRHLTSKDDDLFEE